MSNARIIFSLSLILASGVTPFPAQANAHMQVDSSETYLDELAYLFDSARQRLPADRKGDGPLLRILPDGTVDTTGAGTLTGTDTELVQAAQRLFKFYKSFGGHPGNRALLMQHTRNGLFTAYEGAAGTVSQSLGGAMGGALRAMARADASLPAVAASWVTDYSRALETPGTRPPAYPVARISRGQNSLITLSGPEIIQAGADAILAGPPGSRITVRRTQNGRLEASALFPDTIPAGFAKLYLYRAGDALRPVASYDVSVVTAGRSGATPVEADDHGATPRTATALLAPGETHARREGQIGAQDDVDMFSVRVSAPGTLSLSSRGSSDVTAYLQDQRGNRIASNDDGGTGYNFKMQAPVLPGNYVLSVQHCCGGSGNYRIDSALTPE